MLRYYMFLLRWFLIGKYHCDLPKWAIKYFWLAHKLLWAFIAISIAFTVYEVLTYISNL